MLFTKRKQNGEIMVFKKNQHHVMLDKNTESKFYLNIKMTRRISQRHRRTLNCKIHETSYKTIRMKFSGFKLKGKNKDMLYPYK